MHDTVFFDVDTQNDFLLPVGALYAPGAERLIPAWSRLFEIASRHSIPVISTADAHTNCDPEFASWPPHCIQGTLGQAKTSVTLLPGAVTIPNREEGWPENWRDAIQLVVEKQNVDMFQTLTLKRILAARPARRYVVFGLVTEVCVWNAVRGLYKAANDVEVVTDAIAALTHEGGRAALDEMAKLGAKLVTVETLRLP